MTFIPIIIAAGEALQYLSESEREREGDSAVALVRGNSYHRSSTPRSLAATVVDHGETQTHFPVFSEPSAVTAVKPHQGITPA